MRSFKAMVLPLGVPARDGVSMAAPDIKFVDTKLPLALKWQKTDESGHAGGFTVASIRSLETHDGKLWATGHFLDTPEAHEAMEQISQGVSAPSVEIVVREAVAADREGNTVTADQLVKMAAGGEKMVNKWTSAELVGVTLVSVPNFRETRVELGEEFDPSAEVEAEAIAAAVMIEPDTFEIEAFTVPEYDELTPIHVRADGVVVGHAASWDVCHVGVEAATGKCRTAPKSNSGFAEFHQSHVTTGEGELLRVGRLTVGGGHGPAGRGMKAAVQHYDDVSTTWAYVRAMNGAHGIWISGVINPRANEDMVREAMSAPHSGHWEKVAGNLELIAVHAVNTPGFPILRTVNNSLDEQVALVASAFTPQAEVLDTEDAILLVAQIAREAVAEHIRVEAALQAQREADEKRAESFRELRSMAAARRKARLMSLRGVTAGDADPKGLTTDEHKAGGKHWRLQGRDDGGQWDEMFGPGAVEGPGAKLPRRPSKSKRSSTSDKGSSGSKDTGKASKAAESKDSGKAESKGWEPGKQVTPQNLPTEAETKKEVKDAKANKERSFNRLKKASEEWQAGMKEKGFDFKSPEAQARRKEYDDARADWEAANQRDRDAFDADATRDELKQKREDLEYAFEEYEKASDDIAELEDATLRLNTALAEANAAGFSRDQLDEIEKAATGRTRNAPDSPAVTAVKQRLKDAADKRLDLTGKADRSAGKKALKKAEASKDLSKLSDDELAEALAEARPAAALGLSRMDKGDRERRSRLYDVFEANGEGSTPEERIEREIVRRMDGSGKKSDVKSEPAGPPKYTGGGVENETFENEYKPALTKLLNARSDLTDLLEVLHDERLELRNMDPDNGRERYDAKKKRIEKLEKTEQEWRERARALERAFQDAEKRVDHKGRALEHSEEDAWGDNSPARNNARRLKIPFRSPNPMWEDGWKQDWEPVMTPA